MKRDHFIFTAVSIVFYSLVAFIPMEAKATIDQVYFTNPSGGNYRSDQTLCITLKIVGDDPDEILGLGYNFILVYLPTHLPDLPENYGYIPIYVGSPPLHVCPCCVYYEPRIGKWIGSLYYCKPIPRLDGHQNIEAYGWVLADNVYPNPPMADVWSPGFHLYLMGLPVPRIEPHPEGDRTAQAPDDHFLGAPSPNPFNPSTTIRFGLKEPAFVQLAVYDLNGRLVRTLHDGNYLPAGEHSLTWNGLNDRGVRVVSGIYFLKFRAGDFGETKKLILLR